MNILDNLKSDELRAEYIRNFVDTAKDYFVELIERKTEFSDGLCYTGYLWDCLKNPQVISETEALTSGGVLSMFVTVTILETVLPTSSTHSTSREPFLVKMMSFPETTYSPATR